MRRLATQHLLPGPGRDIELVPRQVHREDGRGRVANRQALAVGLDPIAIGDARARGGAVPGEHHVAVAIDLGKIGKFAVRSAHEAQIGELQLSFHVGRPAFAETLPGQHIDAARTDLESALSRLPPKQRAAVVLRYYQNAPYAEIASALEMDVESVGPLLTRARAALRESLK